MTSAVVTGSNGGIGSATVNAFEAAGFSVHGIDVEDDPAAVFGRLDRLDVLVCAHGISGRKLGDGRSTPAPTKPGLPCSKQICAPCSATAGMRSRATAPFVTGAVLTVDGGWTAR